MLFGNSVLPRFIFYVSSSIIVHIHVHAFLLYEFSQIPFWLVHVHMWNSVQCDS